MPRTSSSRDVLLNFLDHAGLEDQAQLPPERELAAQLGLTRSQLRTGLAKLKAEGRIWGHVGKGTFVGREPLFNPGAVLQLSTLINPREVMEARVAIEPMLASLAALHATPNEFAHMDKCVQMGARARHRADFERWDDALHRAIADAARNSLLVALYNAVNASRQKELWGKSRDSAMASGRRELYIAQHRECVDAIKDRDPGRAAAAMRHHLATISSGCEVFGNGGVAITELPPRKRPAETRIAA